MLMYMNFYSRITDNCPKLKTIPNVSQLENEKANCGTPIPFTTTPQRKGTNNNMNESQIHSTKWKEPDFKN